ncbi:MAG TPA: Flp pilus assembly protein CpaB [Magnetospirillum sp.]|nr:Flp pilus assembly protein CpaB [Magnetospirillum sp.]
MNLRVVLRIVSVLGLALVAALLLRGMFIASTSAPPPPPMAAVQVAVAKLPVGTLLKADDLTWRDVPVAEVQKGDITKGSPAAQKLPGAVVRRAIDEGAAVTDRDVVYPDAPGFLAAALQPGMRAVSVAIDDVSGNAGLTLPGDRVDLILTHSLTTRDSDAGGPPKVASETVLADVRVIAVGQALRIPEAEPANGQQVQSSGNARTVTLEVSPRDAESVAVVSRLGQLSLALRSLAVVRPAADADPSAAEAARRPAEPVWGKDVSQVVRDTAEPVRAAPRQVVSSGAAAAPTPVRVFRGSGDAK